MKRRAFLTLTAAVLVAPTALLAAQDLAYTPGLVDKLLAEGKTVFVDFYTSWCGTCRTQKRRIEALRKENPAYDANMTFVRVDWDIHSDDALSTWLNIPRRSTLVVLRGDEELGRIVAGTRKAAIRKLMDTGLAGGS